MLLTGFVSNPHLNHTEQPLKSSKEQAPSQ